MKKVLKYVAIALAILLVVAQLVRPDFSNPTTNPDEQIGALMEVPADVAAVLKRSCNDCHTNQTVYPWYSKVTPVNWWLKDHIDEGRRELNFDVFSTYNARRKAKKLEEVCEQVESGEMPLPSYLWVHGEATLSADDRKLLCDWSRVGSDKLKGSEN